MAQPNGSGTPPNTRDQFYVPYSRTVQNIRTACMTTIHDLVEDGHPELTAPFARILAELATVDVAALKQLDEAYAEGKKS